MSEQNEATVLIAGHEVKASAAQMVVDLAIPSVRKVIEEMVLKGRSVESTSSAAKTAAEAAVATILWMTNCGSRHQPS